MLRLLREFVMSVEVTEGVCNECCAINGYFQRRRSKNTSALRTQRTELC